MADRKEVGVAGRPGEAGGDAPVLTPVGGAHTSSRSSPQSAGSEVGERGGVTGRTSIPTLEVPEESAGPAGETAPNGTCGLGG